MRPLRVLIGTTLLTGSLVATTAVASSGAPPGPAAAGTATTETTTGPLTQVSGFGDNPGNLAMYEYVPADLPAGAPTVVALHGCTQSAQAYHEGAGWSELAEEAGFAVVYPQQSSANNANSCFNFFEKGDTTRGQGEVASIASMVEYARDAHGLGSGNTFVTGLSAGGGMSAAMLATYPDLFAGGSVIAGLPYRCASSMVEAFGCMSAPPDRSPSQWGDLVRQAAPGFDGTRPKVAIWSGTADTTVDPANARELVDQFTDVAGVGQDATATAELPAGTTRSTYGDDDVVHYSVEDLGHGTPVDPGSGDAQCGQAGAYFLDSICSTKHDAAFFGLIDPVDGGDPGDGTDPDDPGDGTDPGRCVTASNYAHTEAGRARVSGGWTYATGSGDALGLWNVFVTTELEETSPGYWELGC